MSNSKLDRNHPLWPYACLPLCIEFITGIPALDLIGDKPVKEGVHWQEYLPELHKRGWTLAVYERELQVSSTPPRKVWAPDPRKMETPFILILAYGHAVVAGPASPEPMLHNPNGQPIATGKAFWDEAWDFLLEPKKLHVASHIKESSHVQ